MGICSGSSTEWLFVHWNLDRIRIWKCWFLRRGENRSTQRKTSRNGKVNQSKTFNKSNRNQSHCSPTLFESRSTIHTSPGIWKPSHLYRKKLAGTPITNGVGASNSCSALFIHVGSNGMTGNIYSKG